jgi:hypothetical protein
MKYIYFTGLLLVLHFSALAQPAHDNPCGAIVLPVIESSDACDPTRIVFNGATYTAYQVNGSNTCSPSFPTDPDVWYSFIATKTQLKLSILPSQGGNAGCGIYGTSAVEFMILTGNCSGPFTYVTCGRSDIPGTTTLNNLTIGTSYFIKISTGFGYACGTLGACVYTGMPAATARVGINTDQPATNFDVAGLANFRNNTTFNQDIIAGKIVSPNLVVEGNIGSVNNVTILSSLTAGNNGTFGGFLNVGGDASFGGKIFGTKVSLDNTLGNKIGLWGDLNSNHYGFGVQGALFQMHSDAAAANIAFGYGSSGSFTERARIINQGEFGMSLTGRLQLRTGTQSAGLWLNNTANTTTPAFIGLASDNLVGLYGSVGAGWGLAMNATNGNVGIGLNGGNPTRPLSFPAAIGEKILLYPGPNGEVGIGVYGNELRLHSDNPGAKVSFGTQDNAGNFDQTALAQRNGSFAFSVLGSLWVNGTTYASDERFKQNISSIASPLQKLLQIKGVEYEMRTKEFPQYHFTAGRQMGLLAQNVETVAPEAVNEKDGYKGVDYARLVPLLIESIKELKKENDEQKRRIEILEQSLLQH